MTVFDLIERDARVNVVRYGHLEKYFDLSLCGTMSVNYVKVRTPKGNLIALRYSYYNAADKARYEKYIDKHYERVNKEV